MHFTSLSVVPYLHRLFSINAPLCYLWIMLLLTLICTGCATVAPIDEARLFSRAFNSVDGASQPLLDDLSLAERRQGQDNAIFKAKRDKYTGACKGIRWALPGFIEGYCLDDAPYFAAIGDPPATKAFRQGIRLIGEYAEVLLTLAEGRNLDETSAQVQILGDNVTALVNLIPAAGGTGFAISAALSALQPVIKDAAQAKNTKEMKRLVLDGASHVTQLIQSLRRAAPESFNTLTYQSIKKVTSQEAADNEGVAKQYLDRIEAYRIAVSNYVVLLDDLEQAFEQLVVAFQTRRNAVSLARYGLPEEGENMSLTNEARSRITAARNVLMVRRRQTDNANEQAAINDAINELNDLLGVINQAALLDAAEYVLDATTALANVLDSAQLDPLDAYVADVEGILSDMMTLLRNGEVGEHLDSAPESALPPSSPTPPQDVPLPVVTTGSLPPIGAREDFDGLRVEYEAWFEAMTIRPEYQDKVDWHAKQLMKHRARYQEVSPLVNDLPWAMIAVIHAMECGFNFAGHLHNGDPLTSRTTHVPAGRPATGEPPFSWQESAVDALTLEEFNAVTDWSIPHMLYLLEKYNGFGYRNRGLPTPYLWSFSNLYVRGKYVADSRFDPNAVSKQCGAAVMLKVLRDRGELPS